jgi:hypothetical protein
MHDDGTCITIKSDGLGTTTARGISSKQDVIHDEFGKASVAA